MSKGLQRAARLLPLALLLGLVGASVGRPAAAEDEHRVRVVVGEQDVYVEDFLRAVSEAAGVHLLYDPLLPELRRGKIVGHLRLDVPRGDLLDVARSLMAFYDLLLVPVGPAEHRTMVVTSAVEGSRGSLRSLLLRWKPVHVRLTDENLRHYEGRDGLLVTATLRVEHPDGVEGLANALTLQATGGGFGSVAHSGDGRTLVVTDFAPNVVRMYRLLAELDRPPRDTDAVTAVDLRHADAGQALALLAPHFAPRPGAAGSVLTADRRHGRLLVSGPRRAVEAVCAAAQLIDVPASPPSVLPRVLALRHVGAQETARALTAFLGSSPALYRADGREPVVVAHASRNALLVSAGGAGLAAIESLLEGLDRP